MRLDLRRTVRLGVSSLMLHKLRSALTIGVLFGVRRDRDARDGEGASEEAIRQLGSQNGSRSPKPRRPRAGAGRRVNDYGLKDADFGRVATVSACATLSIRRSGGASGPALNPRVLATAGY